MPLAKSATFLLSTLTVCSLGAATPEELVRKSLQNYKRNYREAVTRYTYMERDVERNDAETKITISKVFPVKGFPFEQVVSRNGKPLPSQEQSKQREKLERRRHETPEQLNKRRHDYEKNLSFLDEVPNALKFKLLGEETLDGRATHVVECTPNPAYSPVNSRAAMFAHISAKLWIDQKNVQWAKADAKVLDTISIGWILARIEPGARIELRQARLSDTDWLPSLLDVNGDAKVMLFKDRPIHQHVTYYDFKPVEHAPPGKK